MFFLYRKSVSKTEVPTAFKNTNISQNEEDLAKKDESDELNYFESNENSKEENGHKAYGIDGRKIFDNQTYKTIIFYDCDAYRIQGTDMENKKVYQFDIDEYYEFTIDINEKSLMLILTSMTKLD